MTTLARPVAAAFQSRLRYTDRRSKAAYIADKYAPILIGSVLDVGCDEAPLRNLVHQPFRYVGVDIRADADRVVDLDREKLPFGDREFDTVVCTDVLEHLERCHEVFDELCRVARRHVIVSLPNPLRALLCALAAGGDGRLKYYGLPPERPADRHRWFFGYEEAVEFVRAGAQRNGMQVVQIDAEEEPSPKLFDQQGRNLFELPNVAAGTTWLVLRRGDGAAK